VDIGLAQLAMHSPYETAGTKDTQYLADVMALFFSSSLKTGAPGCYTIQ
jgi:aspartyl aminopeptidase